jgi:hypothetical protein
MQREKNNIKLCLRKIGCKDVERIQIAEVGAQSLEPWNTVMNLGPTNAIKTGGFLTSCAFRSF